MGHLQGNGEKILRRLRFQETFRPFSSRGFELSANDVRAFTQMSLYFIIFFFLNDE